MSEAPAFVFLDLETTGLDPKTDQILELGMVITDKDLNQLAIFGETAQISGIEYDMVHQTYEPPFGIHEKVVEMHTASGLWQDSYRSTMTLADVFAKADSWLFHQLSDSVEPGELPLVGNTIGFDRSFIYEHHPVFLDAFHYRSLDISSIKIAYNAWWDKDDAEQPVGNKLHRAVPDCLDSINELQFYRKHVFL